MKKLVLVGLMVVGSFAKAECDINDPNCFPFVGEPQMVVSLQNFATPYVPAFEEASTLTEQDEVKTKGGIVARKENEMVAPTRRENVIA